MIRIKKYISGSLLALVIVLACNDKVNDAHSHDAEGNHINQAKDSEIQTVHSDDHHDEEILLKQDQIDVLNIKVEQLTKRNMSNYIQVNGILGVPPQNEAIVTSVLGANINSINAIEGDEVKKGQIIGYITHPDIIGLQTDYLQAYNNLTFLEQDFIRQKKLYDAKVGSGRDYQKAKSAFSIAQGLASGYNKQLGLLGLNAALINDGDIFDRAPIISPINGFIEKVLIKSGQYVQAQTPMFEVVNTDHIHADLMVFERDISKVKNGQKVKFKIEALGNTEMTATIYSVGKSFEEGPKALHIHAEIENKDKNLIPGMYVNARIIIEENLEQALPEGGVYQENETFFVFTAKKEGDDTWAFTPEKVIVISTSDEYISFEFIEEVQEDILLAQGGAYYLMAEMKKGEAEHSH